MEKEKRVIYGEDGRFEVYLFPRPRFKEFAKSTSAMLKKERLTFSPEKNRYTLKNSLLLGEIKNFCPSERFLNSPAGVAHCSGFLVGEDLLLTAGHCVKWQPQCEGHFWHFGFEMRPNGSWPSSFSPEELYRCVEVVEIGDPLEKDYALLRLDRKVMGRTPLAFRREGTVGEGELIVIGHPVGLPKKITEGGRIREDQGDYLFLADLDTYFGNSGSPVFHAGTGLVEGLLTKGMRDFIYDRKQKCYRSRQCAMGSCRGEDVVKMTAVDFLQ
ncbi:MAG: serine protease [Bacteriovoracales bacterium]|nr:serine protease [Bacteriovoracales bacterium]